MCTGCIVYYLFFVIIFSVMSSLKISYTDPRPLKRWITEGDGTSMKTFLEFSVNYEKFIKNVGKFQGFRHTYYFVITIS